MPKLNIKSSEFFTRHRNYKWSEMFPKGYFPFAANQSVICRNRTASQKPGNFENLHSTNELLLVGFQQGYSKRGLGINQKCSKGIQRFIAIKIKGIQYKSSSCSVDIFSSR